VVVGGRYLSVGARRRSGGNGPFGRPGGRSELGSGDDPQAIWIRQIDTIPPEAGILWWLEFVKETYGPWGPPPPKSPRTEEEEGTFCFLTRRPGGHTGEGGRCRTSLFPCLTLRG
jgi:hypothetical protein